MSTPLAEQVFYPSAYRPADRYDLFVRLRPLSQKPVVFFFRGLPVLPHVAENLIWLRPQRGQLLHSFSRHHRKSRFPGVVCHVKESARNDRRHATSPMFPLAAPSEPNPFRIMYPYLRSPLNPPVGFVLEWVIIFLGYILSRCRFSGRCCLCAHVVGSPCSRFWSCLAVFGA